MGVKLVSAVLMAALVLSGPLTPLAWSQEKTEGQMAPSKGKGDGAWEFAAGVTNTIAVPGRAFLCGVGALTGVAVLLITFGSGTEAAAGVWQETGSGKWTVTAADLKPKEAESEYLIDRPDYRLSDYQKTQ